ncbi:malonyl-CoA decarboxylase [Marinobacter halophilus]|uniref:Malonyl-CoA decarboxylase n=1 Tax=Marinobacter halophilus TaxID=1323740 RepID=A0A2T1KKL8_9GAMM|nr:malonyl-CoA decarboxylase [Marinobacter halophilus]PSF10263.1 malonyl-CoA decarboxylase [Marinobacter halophilus]GGC69131.1 malonyl-CoA decarboxylase [Marinobacter halophilus]
MQSQPVSIFERAFKKLVPGGLEAVGRRGSDIMNIAADLPEADITAVKEWIDNCLAQNGGQVEARNRAAMLGRAYLKLSVTGKTRFLGLLAEHYGVNESSVEKAIDQWHNAKSSQKTEAAQALRRALEPSRTALLKQFNGVPSGVKFLVDMRDELLTFCKDYPALKSLETDLQDLLATWFDIGLLQLEEINWHSSAAMLEKLIAYEAVHAIKSWNDLKNRLDSDRRCFAFIHPNMPDEPLIFVEVALVNGLAGNVQKLLDEDAPTQDIDTADTAIFYSISNAQRGLAGISFGNFLIKQVVKKLRDEFPQLKQFATLSPIPGFRRWLENTTAEQLAHLPGGEQWLSYPPPRDPVLANQTDTTGGQQEAILKLAASYLCSTKPDSGRANDPVAHFHLSNGAQVARLNWMADTSDKGLKQSAGLMVNYLYELPKIVHRSQQYTSIGAVSQSSAIKKLLK